MFTGIIEEKGKVVSFESRCRVWVLNVAAKKVCAGLKKGASVSVNGVCLTAVKAGRSQISFEIQGETQRRTALGSLRPGDTVNLERAMPACGRFDGHVVQGHVDGVGTVESFEKKGRDVVLRVRYPQRIKPYLVPQGSIAVDGVSLTLVDLENGCFTAHLIPHTLKETNLDARQKGDKLNLETDVIGKYVYWNLNRDAQSE